MCTLFIKITFRYVQRVIQIYNGYKIIKIMPRCWLPVNPVLTRTEDGEGGLWEDLEIIPKDEILIIF